MAVGKLKIVILSADMATMGITAVAGMAITLATATIAAMAAAITTTMATTLASMATIGNMRIIVGIISAPSAATTTIAVIDPASHPDIQPDRDANAAIIFSINIL